MLSRVSKLVSGVAMCLAFAAQAQAQIYTWRDASGTLVLSTRPLGALNRPSTESAAVDPAGTTPPAVTVARPQYDDLILEHARTNAVRSELVRAVVQVESAFNPNAISPKGAMGLMQLMPNTARQFGVQNPFSPEQNVRAGVAYLRQLLDRYDNDEPLALAAYNAGPGAVDRHGQNIPPYRETKDYVARVNRLTKAARPTQRPGSVIYKTTETINGREVARYSDHRPSTGSYEIVKAR